MSLATMQPVAVDTELENLIADSLEALLANRGSSRLPFRLAVQQSEPHRREIIELLKQQLDTIHPFKVEQTFLSIIRSPEKLKQFEQWMRPSKPRR